MKIKLLNIFLAAVLVAMAALTSGCATQAIRASTMEPKKLQVYVEKGNSQELFQQAQQYEAKGNLALAEVYYLRAFDADSKMKGSVSKALHKLNQRMKGGNQ